MDNQDELFDTIDSDENSYASLSGERDSSMDIYSPFDVDAETWSNDAYRWGEFVGRINRLPVSAQNVLFDANTTYLIKDVTSNHDLTEEQTKNLSRIVRDTILGDLVLEEMSANIVNKLNVSTEEATAMASLITSELFKPVSLSKPDRLQYPPRPIPPRPSIPERPDLKIEPDVNKNNVVDLRNKP